MAHPRSHVSWDISSGAVGLGRGTISRGSQTAYDGGINTWDTANAYSNGVSEEIIGKAIRKFGIPREKLVIMTKCGFAVGEQPNN
ncbi:NADP-dependent oxidoreductase domain-containing protein [Lipomyces starkeyi]